MRGSSLSEKVKERKKEEKKKTYPLGTPARSEMILTAETDPNRANSDSKSHSLVYVRLCSLYYSLYRSLYYSLYFSRYFPSYFCCCFGSLVEKKKRVFVSKMREWREKRVKEKGESKKNLETNRGRSNPNVCQYSFPDSPS